MTPESQPRLAAKARLRWDRITGHSLLLSPERGLDLNATASVIIERCTGTQTVASLIQELRASHAETSADVMTQDVLNFLHALEDLGLMLEAHDTRSR